MSPRINQLLAELPDEEYQRIYPYLETAVLSKGHDLWPSGKAPSHVYFPVGAVVSLMIDLSDGFSVEAFMLGKQSLFGSSMDPQPSFYRARVRTGGLAYRLPIGHFQVLMKQCPTLVRQMATQMGRNMVRQICHAMVCGKHHSVDQQLVRWLLTTLDISLDCRIEMTHQEIWELLGFRREAITLALRKLTDGGHVSVRRGEIEVLQRDALEAMACDCYWLANGQVRPEHAHGWGTTLAQSALGRRA
jgi:CRP-like cAMP-binding protein